MDARRSATRSCAATALLAISVLFAGCYAGFWTYKSQGGGLEAAIGEDHEVNRPADETFVLVQDVLRGAGVLFDVKPDNSLTTYWKAGDTGPGMLGSLIGVLPRYHYEIQVLPLTSTKSKVVVNVRTEDLPEDQVASYKASQRLDFFNKLDAQVALAPPSSKIPASGGVNFTLLPNEDLKGLAQRATGNAANWQQIAADNGLGSASDVTPFQTVWVRNSLLKVKSKAP